MRNFVYFIQLPNEVIDEELIGYWSVFADCSRLIFSLFVDRIAGKCRLFGLPMHFT